MSSTNGYTIDVAKSTEDISALRDACQDLQTHPDADMDFYLALLNSQKNILRPHVVVLKKEGVIQSILVGRIEKRSLDVAFGYKKFSLPSIHCLTVMGGGPVGDTSPEICSALMRSIEDSLKDKEADAVWFHQLNVSSPMYEILRKTTNIFRGDHFPLLNDHWKARLPATYVEFIQQKSSNTRHNLKRYSKRFKEAFGGQISIKQFSEPSQIETVLNDTETVARLGYLRNLQVGFVNDDLTRRRMALYLKQQRFRGYILYIGEKPIAYWNGFVYGKTFFTWTTGYDPEYGDFRPGSFLLQRMFEDICGEQVANEVDFGSGDAQYKRDWCDQNQREVSVHLFAPSFKGIGLNALRTPLMAGSMFARWIVTKTGLLGKIKKSWRGRLTSSATARAAKA